MSTTIILIAVVVIAGLYMWYVHSNVVVPLAATATTSTPTVQTNAITSITGKAQNVMNTAKGGLKKF